MKKFWFIVVVINLFIFSGCWDMREINDLGFVTAVGVDKAKSPNKYTVTVQIANASSASAKSEQGPTQTGVWVGTEEGKTIFAAVRNLIRISSRRVMWAHNNVVIIGESLAKEGVLPVADFFTHNPELRMKTPVVIARGEAKDYILAKAGMEAPSGLSFIYFRDFSKLLAETISSSMLTLKEALASQYFDPLMAAVSLKKAEETSESSGKSSEGKESKTIDIAGTAVFHRDKLVGWLTPQETRGLAWILNENRDAIVTAIDPVHKHQNVAVETKGVKTRIIAKVVKGLPHVMIRISGGGNIVEEDGETGGEIEEVKKRVEGWLDRRIARDIQISLKKIQQEYKTDVIRLATFVHSQNNWEWENWLKYKWQEIFPQVLFKVSVSMHIHSSMLKQEPAKIAR